MFSLCFIKFLKLSALILYLVFLFFIFVADGVKIIDGFFELLKSVVRSVGSFYQLLLFCFYLFVKLFELCIKGILAFGKVLCVLFFELLKLGFGVKSLVY